MQQRRGIGVILGWAAVCIAAMPVMAEDVKKAPAEVQAAVLFKLLEFNKGVAGGGEVTLYVVACPEFAAAMKPAVGKALGGSASKLGNVVESPDAPTAKPTGLAVIYVGDGDKLDAVVKYSRESKILSLTGVPELVSKGVTLGVGVLDGKPKILLNLSSTKEEGIEWNPAILKVASSIK